MKQSSTNFPISASSLTSEHSDQSHLRNLARDNDILIPRKILFGNSDKSEVRLSPDGSKISYLAPVNGVLNIWVGPVNDPEAAKPVTEETHRGIRIYIWAYTSEHVLYLQDKNGDENDHIYSINLRNGNILDLTPFEDVQALFLSASDRIPQEVVIGLNKRNPHYHDLYRLNIDTGNITLIMENNEFNVVIVDDDYNVRFAEKMTPDGGKNIFKRTEYGNWKLFSKVRMEDYLTTAILGFNSTGEVVYIMDSSDLSTAALFSLNLKNSRKNLIAQDPRADLIHILVHPTEKNVQAAAFNYKRIHWQIIDEAIVDDLEYLHKVAPGDLHILSRTLDDNAWIVVYNSDRGPARYYYYARDTREAKFLFLDNEALCGQSLSKMVPAIIVSRDGLEMVSYYTLPQNSDEDEDGKPDRPLPMVLFVHGGPWARDVYGYNPEHQWLANRGYAVLSINFRGSTGFGKNFVNAGNLEWGRKMHQDLIDAVNWAVQEGIADPRRVAIMGGSYGGYAVLAGLTITPKVFACGVDLFGPSNLITLLESIPPYWKSRVEMYAARIGDFRTKDGREFLEEQSPLSHVMRIKRPLLIGQGANDPRVKQSESDQIVKIMQAKNLPVTYMLYADEGHGFVRPENSIAFYAVVEAFLGMHLGGRVEPIGKDFHDANFTVPTGIREIPGLYEAILNSS